MRKKLLLFQHVPWEGPGRFLTDIAKEKQVDLEVCRVYREALPADLGAFDGFIILGGSPNVDEEAVYPFLTDEKAAIKKIIALDRPLLGFCLGHQLLAEAMGAKIGPNPATSIGFINGFLCHHGREHPLFAGLPERLPLFKWHGYAVQEPLPEALEVLATSRDCQVEAISLKGRPHISGLQFDNHAAHPDDVSSWVREDESWLASRKDLRISPWALIQEAAAQQELQRDFFAGIMTNFFKFLNR